VGTYYTVTIVAAKAFLGDIWSTNSPPNSKKGQPAGLFGRHVRNSYGLMPASYPTRVSAADESK